MVNGQSVNGELVLLEGIADLNQFNVQCAMLNNQYSIIRLLP